MKYLLLKPSLNAGLGDSILSLIQAVAYAKLTNRELCVDWRGGMYGMPEQSNLFDKIFSVQEIPYVSKIPSVSSIHPAKWKHAIYKSFEQLRMEDQNTHWNKKQAIIEYSTDAGILDYPQEMIVMWDFEQFKKLLKPLVKSEIITNVHSLFIAMGEVFNRYVSLQSEPDDYIDSSWRKMTGNVLGGKVIGVHIREIKESMDCYGMVRRERYFNAINSILKLDKDSGFIFLATDNERVQQEFVSTYGSKVLFKPKWFSAPGEPIHVSLGQCPDKWRNILDALFDMFALARCDYLVRRKETSFSKVSQCVGLIEDQNVVILHKEPNMNQKIMNKLSIIKHQFVNNFRRFK